MKTWKLSTDEIKVWDPAWPGLALPGTKLFFTDVLFWLDFCLENVRQIIEESGGLIKMINTCCWFWWSGWWFSRISWCRHHTYLLPGWDTDLDVNRGSSKLINYTTFMQITCWLNYFSRVPKFLKLSSHNYHMAACI